MAEIDVSELLVDPLFVDAVQILYRTQSVNSKGENTLSESTTNTVGSVQSITPDAFKRLPEALRVLNMHSFWVKGNIAQTTASNDYPDILVFGGRRYQIQTVFDWTNWGAGWCEGVCVAEKPS